MKTVSIRELHSRTGALVREAAKQPIQVTERGTVIAVIQAPAVAGARGVSLPDREAWIARLPAQTRDSADVVADDRDR